MTRPVFLSCTYSACPDPDLAELLELRGYLLIMKNGLTALQVACELKYSPDQPRWPAGYPRGGQWMPKEGGEEGVPEELERDAAEDSESLSAFGEAPDETPIEPVGGIPESEKGSTVQSFMSRYCNAGTRAEMPGQFLGMTILEVMQLAKQGDSAARTCLKLLKKNEYRK